MDQNEKKVQNIGTKSAFTPNMFTHYKKHYQHITLNINEKYQIKYAKFYCVQNCKKGPIKSTKQILRKHKFAYNKMYN